MEKKAPTNIWILRVQWLMTVIVFFIFPFLLLTFGAGIIWTSMEKESVSTQFARMDTMLLTLSRKGETPSYLKSLLQKAHALSVIRPESRNSVLARMFQNLDRRFPGTFSFFPVDARGRIIPELSREQGMGEGVRELFLILQRKARGLPVPPQLIQESAPRLRGLLGQREQKTLFAPEIATTFFWETVSPSGTPQFIFADIQRQGGLIVKLIPPEAWETQGILDIIRRFNRFQQPRDLEMGYYNPMSSEIVNPEMLRVLGEFERYGQGRVQTGKHFYSLLRFGRQSLLWIKAPRKTTVDFTTERLIVTLFGALFLTGCAYFSCRVILGLIPFTLSIRNRLVILFLFTAGLPLLAMLLAGLDYLKKMEVELIQQADSKATEILRRFDSRYQREFVSIEAEIAKAGPTLSKLMDSRLPRFGGFLLPLFKKTRAQKAFLFNHDGRCLVRFQPSHTGNETNEALLKGICLSTLKELNGTHGIDPASASQSSFDSSRGLPATWNPARSPGRLIDLNIGEEDHYSLFLPIRGKTRSYSGILLIRWKKGRMAHSYVLRRLPSLQVEEGKNRRHEALNSPGSRGISGRNPGTSDLLFYVKFPEESFSVPGKLPTRQRFLTRAIDRLIENMRLKDRGESARVRHLGERYSLTGHKGKELAGAYLVAVQAESDILATIRTWKLGLGGFVGIIVLVSVFFGLMLSQRFLLPITHLTRGVEAIRERAFKYRVPEGDPDELGTLARTFNEVMDGLSELEVGRIVQESLYPQSGMETGEYRIFGKTVSASKLSGDYFDIQALPDKKILFLIGDVTGHGVGAALVMSMAKGLVQREMEGPIHPEKLLTTLHQVFIKALRKRTIMSCCVGLLDPLNHTLCLANAGHTFPYLFRHGSAPQQLSYSSPPLAVRPNQKFNSQTFDLHPGDMFFFYTDGILEAMTSSGPVNYHRMVKALLCFADRDPKKMWEAFFKWHRSITIPGVQSDDMTALFLNRK